MSMCQVLHNTLIYLTEFYYDSMGLTGLFVPTEVLGLNVQTALRDNALIARLDSKYFDLFSHLVIHILMSTQVSC